MTDVSDMRLLLRFILNKQPHQNRPESYLQFLQQHGLNGIDYPVSPLDIPKFEERLNLSINVFCYVDDIGKDRHPMYISRRNARVKVNLLYFNRHYAWIKNISRCFGDLTKHNGQTFFCFYVVSDTSHWRKGSRDMNSSAIARNIFPRSTSFQIQTVQLYLQTGNISQRLHS